MESLQHKRRKILLLFLLGVGLPSLVLGFLAFRGIRNEQDRLAQRRVSEYRTVVPLLEDLVATEVGAAERALGAAVADPDPADLTALRRELQDVRLQPLVEEVLHLEADGRVTPPAADLLYTEDGSLPGSSTRSWPAAPAAQLQVARQQEFQLRQYADALAGYRRVFTAVSDQALRGEALLAVARVQQKAGQSEAALRSCEILADDYGHIRTATGPLGAIARLQRGNLLQAEGDSEAAIAAFIDLYEGLNEGRWPLERAQYDFFSTQAAEAVSLALTRLTDRDVREAHLRALDELQATGAARKRQTDRFLLLQSAGGLGARLRITGGTVPAAERHTTFEVAGQTYLISWLDRSLTGDVWGVLVDENALADLVRRSLDERLDPASTTWTVTGRDGRSLVASVDQPASPPAHVATFTDNFPPWLIEFSDRPQSTYRWLFASSQSIFFYMFLLIAGILGFGFVLTVRAMSHELELARLKSDFVSSVSHEFKSPLTAISHLSEMLQAGSVRSETRRQQYYDVLVEQSGRLSSLVSNILDLARLEGGRQEFTLEPVDPAALVRELVTTVQQREAHEDVAIDLDITGTPLRIRADRTALAHAVTNLLDNAIKYSPDVKSVEVRVSADAGRVAIAVRDHGVGIPASEISHVFERFYRGGHALAYAVKGSGLGLTLVKEIVEAHGGTVRAASVPGQGSTFTIELPATTG